MSEAQQEFPHGNNDDDALEAIDALIAAPPTEPETDPGDDMGAEETEDLEAEDAPEDEEVEEPEETQEPEIDYELMIPMADGRDAMKLGDLKDAVNDLERGKQDVDTQRMAQIKQETELNQYIAQAGITVPPEFQKYMAEKQEQHLQTQHELMLQMVPEMALKEGFTKMREGIVATAAKSNFTAEEIGQLSDARVVHLLNRLATLEAKELRAQETVKQVKAKPKLKSVQRRQAGTQSKLDRQIKHAMTGTRSDKDAAIDALING